MNLAVLLEQAGDMAGAEAAYRRADAMGFAGGAYGLGQLLYERSDISGAIEANRRADLLGDADGSFNLGFLLKRSGDLVGPKPLSPGRRTGPRFLPDPQESCRGTRSPRCRRGRVRRAEATVTPTEN